MPKALNRNSRTLLVVTVTVITIVCGVVGWAFVLTNSNAAVNATQTTQIESLVKQQDRIVQKLDQIDEKLDRIATQVASLQ